MSEQKFPGRIWITNPDTDFLRMQNLGPQHEWLHLTEHKHILAEKEKRIERLNERWLVEQILEWKYAWMDVKGTDERDRENYFHRAFGVDANMQYNLARRILAALQEDGE
jgi:hypothetical protein